ncbi:hypothetical protein [Paenibacillus sp. FSL P2-0173]|uniref:hypothetical protein n=1 Tax=Paenibacillus sp. FSL P2-0173 TaxID=2921627 RepID=UPI0030F85F84
MTTYQFEVWKRKRRKRALGNFIRHLQDSFVNLFVEDGFPKPLVEAVLNFDRVQIGTVELVNQTVEVVYDSPPPLTPEYS